MTKKYPVLFVDDEQNILISYKRNLRKYFQVETAGSGPEALELMKSKGPFAVIVSDMQMPVMDGARFLEKARAIDKDSVRMILTGFANIENAISAVNNGFIFRFLTKPCPPESLIAAIEEGIRQYQLIHAERELLEDTLQNSIGVLTAILGMVNPQAFGRANRIKQYVHQIAERLKLKDIWQLDMAAMLSQIGFVTLPPHILDKIYNGEILTEKEQIMLEEHPGIGGSLIEKIPRMDIIAAIIRDQNKKFSEHEAPAALTPRKKFISLGAQILKVVLAFDGYIYRGMSKAAAISMLERDQNSYNRQIVSLLSDLQVLEKERIRKSLPLDKLVSGVITEFPIISAKGKMLVNKDIQLTEPLIQRLKAYDRSVGIRQPIKVLM